MIINTKDESLTIKVNMNIISKDQQKQKITYKDLKKHVVDINSLDYNQINPQETQEEKKNEGFNPNKSDALPNSDITHADEGNTMNNFDSVNSIQSTKIDYDYFKDIMFVFDSNCLILEYFKFKYDSSSRDSISLVSSIESFKYNYKNEEIQNKLTDIHEKYQVGGVRGIRGDGNCLYRSYLVLYIEHILLNMNQNHKAKFMRKIVSDISKMDLGENIYLSFSSHIKSLGYTIEAGKEICIAILKFFLALIEYNILDGNEIYLLFMINLSKNNILDNYLICWIRKKFFDFLHDKIYEDIDGVPFFMVCVEEDKDYSNYLFKKVMKYGEEGETIINKVFPSMFGLPSRIINMTISKRNDKRTIDVYDAEFLIVPSCFDSLNDEDKELAILMRQNLHTCLLFHKDNHFDILYSIDDFIRISNSESQFNNIKYDWEGLRKRFHSKGINFWK